MIEQLIRMTSDPNRNRSAHGPAVLPLAVWLRTREWGGARLQGRRHHHPHQSDRRELVRRDDQWRIRLFSHKLRGGPSAPTAMRFVTLTQWETLYGCFIFYCFILQHQRVVSQDNRNSIQSAWLIISKYLVTWTPEKSGRLYFSLFISLLYAVFCVRFRFSLSALFFHLYEWLAPFVLFIFVCFLVLFVLIPVCWAVWVPALSLHVTETQFMKCE